MAPCRPRSLSWWVDLHHDTHTHPLQLETQGGQGTVSIPTRGETSSNIWYRFHLRATDSAGLSSEVSRDVLPQKARITLATVPPGLQLTLDGQPVDDAAHGDRRERHRARPGGTCAEHGRPPL